LTSLVLPGDSTAGSTRRVLGWLLTSIYRPHVVVYWQLLTEQRTLFFTKYAYCTMAVCKVGNRTSTQSQGREIVFDV